MYVIPFSNVLKSMISFSYCRNNNAILLSATGPITISYLLSLLHRTSPSFENARLRLFITNFAHFSVVYIPKSLIFLRLSFNIRQIETLPKVFIRSAHCQIDTINHNIISMIYLIAYLHFFGTARLNPPVSSQNPVYVPHHSFP